MRRGHLRKLRRALVLRLGITRKRGRDVGLAESGFRPTEICFLPAGLISPDPTEPHDPDLGVLCERAHTAPPNWATFIWSLVD
jgi:hypothetical protein